MEALISALRLLLELAMIVFFLLLDEDDVADFGFFRTMSHN